VDCGSCSCSSPGAAAVQRCCALAVVLRRPPQRGALWGGEDLSQQQQLLLLLLLQAHRCCCSNSRRGRRHQAHTPTRRLTALEGAAAFASWRCCERCWRGQQGMPLLLAGIQQHLPLQAASAAAATKVAARCLRHAQLLQQLLVPPGH
jgi:hypothetical protein